jgi:hypothetical protein
VNSFKDHYRKFHKDGTAVKRRHVDSMFVNNTTNPDMKHSNDVVPVSHRADNNNVQEFEILKKQPRGTKVINRAKALKLTQQFNLKGYTGTLGNTGISMQPHQTAGLYILQK